MTRALCHASSGRRARRFMTVLLVATLIPASTAIALDEPDVEAVNDPVAAQPAAPWHLDRVDGTDDGTYSYGPLGQGVYVYVIDSGVAHDHPDFTGRVLELPGSDFVDGDDTPRPCPPNEGGEGGEVAHGTHVASIAAGFGYGLAKEATIVPLRVFDCDHSTPGILAALAKVAEHNASLGYPPAVVNMSLRATCDGAYCETDPSSTEYDPQAKAYLDAVQPLLDQGILVVVAAGNDGTTSDPLACQNAPAFLGAGRDGVITVGNMTESGKRNSSSSYGSCVDIYAPGTGVTAADDRDPTGAATIIGTSMASPMVAGAVALVLSENPGLAKEDRPSAVWAVLADAAATFPSDKSPDAALQLRNPSRWANRSATTRSTGYVRLEFDEAVTGLEAGDISFEGTATGCAAEVAAVSASSYTIAVVCTSDGTVIPVLAADAVTSVADGDPAPPSSQRITHLRRDTSAPALTGPPSVVSISGSRVTYQLSLSEPVFGLSADDFTLSGNAGGCTVTRVSGTGAYYKAAVTCETNGELTLTLKTGSVVDLAGNSGPADQVNSGVFTLTGAAAATTPTTTTTTTPTTTPTTTTTTTPTTTTTTTTLPTTTVITTSTTLSSPTGTGGAVPGDSNSATPVTTPATTPRASTTVPMAPAAKATTGVFEGSTLAVGTGRIRVGIAPEVAARTVLVEIRNRRGKTVRTLTMKPRETREATLFLSGGIYRLTLRSGEAVWTLRTIRVPR